MNISRRLKERNKKRMRNLRNDKAKSETNIDDAQPIDKGNEEALVWD